MTNISLPVLEHEQVRCPLRLSRISIRGTCLTCMFYKRIFSLDFGVSFRIACGYPNNRNFYKRKE